MSASFLAFTLSFATAARLTYASEATCERGAGYSQWTMTGRTDEASTTGDVVDSGISEELWRTASQGGESSARPEGGTKTTSHLSGSAQATRLIQQKH